MRKHFFLTNLIAVFCLFLAIAAQPVKAQAPISYDEFLSMREDRDLVILNAAQLEKYFMVVPEEMAKQGKGLSQSQLDLLLASLIPTKETKVILFCHQNFQPTRMLSASESVSYALKENGYTNVRFLENLWGNGSHEEAEKARMLGEKEIIPFSKKIPENFPLVNKSE